MLHQHRNGELFCTGAAPEGAMTCVINEWQLVARGPGVLRLYIARGLRGFGDGFAIIVLPAYMTALGYNSTAIGIVATSALFGTHC